jgi:transitional endoplasmic reticulum ATPase
MPRPQKVDAIKVVRWEGQKISVPEKMSLDEAINVLRRMRDYEEQHIAFSEPIEGTIADAAIAFHKAMEEIAGFANPQAMKSFFGSNPPQEIGFESGVNETTTVYWGTFSMPGIEDGYVSLDTQWVDENTRQQLVVNGEFKRKYRDYVKSIVERAREIARKQSIYRGKALRVKFRDKDGEIVPDVRPKFMDLSRAEWENLVLPDDVHASVFTNIIAPIRHTDACRRADIPVKRGITAFGDFGTGKTMIAYLTAHECVVSEHGWTFIYLEDVADIELAINWGKMFQPCVIFAEDVDRTMKEGARTAAVNKVLNVIDGVDSKSHEIMIVLTTNNVESIQRAMLRPGRGGDAIIHIRHPDAMAAEKLIIQYGGESLAPKQDWSVPARLLAGKIPAIIREAVERSKLAAIYRSKGDADALIVADDIEVFAREMDAQSRHVQSVNGDRWSNEEKVAAMLGVMIGAGASGKLPVPAPPSDIDIDALYKSVFTDGRHGVSEAEVVA